jgi:hypothetical protein
VEGSRRYPISKSKFEELIEPIINEELKKPGSPRKISLYNFFCDVLYALRTGIPWRDLPK